MKPTKKKLFLSLGLLLLPIIQLEAQSVQQKDFNIIIAGSDKFKNYASDFQEFIKNQPKDSFEKELAGELRDLAMQDFERLKVLTLLLGIFSRIKCVDDQVIVLSSLKFQARYYSKMLELDVNAINVHLSYSKNTLLTVTGAKLKEDIRELISSMERLSNE